jgi:RNA polymerase sigma factor (sigma-70 family)
MPEPADTHDDASLAQRIRSGDREALGELYDRYASVALATALRVVSDRGQAEDVVHDAFLAVWAKIDRFDPARGGFRAWLVTVVRNRAIDHIRAQRGGPALAVLDEQALLSTGANPTWDEAVRRLSAGDLRAAVLSLPPEQRTAIELAYFAGRTYREIAALTGVPQGTANGRLRLGLARLRDALRGTEAGPAASPVAEALER